MLVTDALRRTNVQSSEALLDAAPERLSRELTLRYYSKALLATPRARAVFVEPDEAPLPELRARDYAARLTVLITKTRVCTPPAAPASRVATGAVHRGCTARSPSARAMPGRARWARLARFGF
jgi:hypothetical protein